MTARPRSGAEGGGATVYLVSCVKEKRATRGRARELYTSPWFRKAREYVERTGQPWFLLSARHGLLEPEAMVRPYDRSLEAMPQAERRRWADRVLGQLAARVAAGDTLVVLAGQLYREFIEPEMRDRGVAVEVPLEGMRIGEQLAWFDGQRPGDRAAGAAMDDLLD